MGAPRKAGWSRQQPIKRAMQRDEAAIEDFLKRGAAKRLHLEQLPGYAPDLNLDEGIWNYLKRVELGKLFCHVDS
jgi:hypothetical protein